MEKAVVLLSGGMDSATTLYWALKKKKWQCHCLILDYGQRHLKELESAKKLARLTHCPFEIVKFSLPWKGSSLLEKNKKIPVHPVSKIGQGAIPSTYVPARNTVFLSLALSWADAIQAKHIVIGANALDYSGYPDCRPGFFRAYQKAAQYGTRLGMEKKQAVRIWTPLIRMSKKQIIEFGRCLNVPLADTWSCYTGRRAPCGQCDACRLRDKGFQEASGSTVLI